MYNFFKSNTCVKNSLNLVNHVSLDKAYYLTYQQQILVIADPNLSIVFK